MESLNGRVILIVFAFVILISMQYTMNLILKELRELKKTIKTVRENENIRRN